MEEAGGMEDHYEAMHETRGPQSKSYPRVVLTGLALFGTACGSLFYMAYDTTPFLEDSMDVVDPNATVSADGLSQCSRFTDGTCRLLPCHSWRGKTQCVGGLLHGTCECMPGYCVNDWGVCVPPPGTCPKDTGGTCRFFGCSSSRGPTDCVDGKCVCKEGTCADVHGFCDRPTAVPPCPSDTGHTCRFFGCAAELGDTECRYGKCLCKADQCGTLTGKCRPRGFCGKDTGGSCRHLSCYGSRGPTECIDGECRCQPGFCAENSGSGYGVCDIRKGQGTEFINYGKYNATVAPVNQEHREFPWPHNKVKTAVCISGGGARALTWALGAYRTLEALGLMRHVDAVSSVSGGTWASAIYMFARAPLEELLGAPAPPEAVTVEYIDRAVTVECMDRVPPALGAVVTTGYATFAKRNALSRMRAADAYVDYVGQTFLGPFGLGNATHFMAGSPEDVERIKRDNRELRHEAFLTPVPGRPKVFVMGGMIGPPVGFAAGPENAILIEMSPDYVGAPFWPNDGKVTYQPAPGSGVPPLTATIGGGLVEAFAFGGVAPRDQSGGTEVPLPSPLQPFSLAKAVGISSFGPSLDLSGRLGLTCAIPRGELWPVTSEHEGAKIHELGDAGNMENSGVVAMLQRGAEKIAMWVNTPVPLGTGYDFCAPNASDQPFRGEWIKDKVDVIFSALFGSGVDTVDDGYLGHNQVFPQEDLAPTLCALQELKKAGKPLVYKASFSVQPNEWWGILGGWSVEVVMVYADKSTEFESKLPAETQAALPKNYPYYDTGLYLTKRQVNILSAQSEYSIRTNEASFREVLCPRGLGGYCCRHPAICGR